MNVTYTVKAGDTLYGISNQFGVSVTELANLNNVKAILTAIGGFNVNQILEHIDYKIIRQHPKILCGYSDITALLNAIYAKTGLITYQEFTVAYISLL